MDIVNRISPGDGDSRHGTTGGYSNHRCRCDRCRAAWAKYCGEYYTRVLAKARKESVCGTESKYKAGCRCGLCKKAAADERWRRRWADIETHRAHDREYRRAIRAARKDAA